MGILVFASYTTKDTELFQISKVAETLTQFSEIDDVLYWEKDLDDDIYEYMNKNLKKCDVFLLFCSENIENSEPVKMEWMTALKLKKKIIPVFLKEEHIPPLLSTKYGIFFNRNNIRPIIEKIYQLILKKYESRKETPQKIKEPEKIEEFQPLHKTLNPRVRLVGDYFIKNIVMSGFSSYGNKPISISFSKNLTSIIGPNGSGKSNFINAILFALNSSKSDLENLLYTSHVENNNVKKASITLQFDHKRGIFPNYPFFNLTRTFQEGGMDIRKINNNIVSISEFNNALSTIEVDDGTIKSQRFFLDGIKIDQFISANPNNRLKYVGLLVGAYNGDYKWNYEKFKKKINFIKQEFYKIILKYYPALSCEIVVDNEEDISKGEIKFRIKGFGKYILSFEELSGGEKYFIFFCCIMQF